MRAAPSASASGTWCASLYNSGLILSAQLVCTRGGRLGRGRGSATIVDSGHDGPYAASGHPSCMCVSTSTPHEAQQHSEPVPHTPVFFRQMAQASALFGMDTYWISTLRGNIQHQSSTSGGMQSSVMRAPDGTKLDVTCMSPVDVSNSCVSAKATCCCCNASL